MDERGKTMADPRKGQSEAPPTPAEEDTAELSDDELEKVVGGRRNWTPHQLRPGAVLRDGDEEAQAVEGPGLWVMDSLMTIED
jgi:bacteriocin-like protein